MSHLRNLSRLAPMTDQHFDLTTRLMKWGLFAVLFATAPAPVIVFKTFMTGPVIFVAASIVTMIAEQWAPNTAMSPMLIGYFALHLMLFTGLYFLAAIGLARLISLIPARPARIIGFLGLIIAALAPAFLPLYGGAGIHGGDWGTLAWFFEILDRSHFGPWAAVKIYGGLGAVLGAACLYVLLRHGNRRGKPRPHQAG